MSGYQENDTDIDAIWKLAEDVRDAVSEYQVSPDIPMITSIVESSWPAAFSTEAVIRAKL